MRGFYTHAIEELIAGHIHTAVSLLMAMAITPAVP